MRRRRWQETAVGELVSEFLGTFITVAFRDGVVAIVAALKVAGEGADIIDQPGGAA